MPEDSITGMYIPGLAIHLDVIKPPRHSPLKPDQLQPDPFVALGHEPVARSRVGDSPLMEVILPELIPPVEVEHSAGPYTPDQPTNTGTISGQVRNAQGVPLANIVVNLDGPGYGQGTCTDQNGNYSFSATFGVDWRVHAAPNGTNTCGGPDTYATQFWDHASYWWSATTITLSQASPTRNGINFDLQPGGGISGHVYQADGVTPVQGACINVSTSSISWNQVSGWGTTGADGSFLFYGIPLGTVYIKTHASCNGQNPTLLDEWYAIGGSTPFENQASPVTITTGQITPNINFQLDLAGAISGHVFKEDGQTVITDRLISVHAIGFSPIHNGQGTYASQSDGSYIIGGLPPGTYKVMGNNNRELGYETQYYNDKPRWEDADLVVVTAGQTTPGIDFNLGPAGSISGHVTQANGITPIADAWVYVMDSNFDFLEGTLTGSDGSYTIGGLVSGSYYSAVSADGYGGVYYNNGYDDPHATLITVTAPNPTTGIDYHLSPEATVSGHVYRSDGVTPIAGAKVDAWPYAGGQIREGTTDGSGAYSVGELSTGSYVVYVTADGFVSEYYQNAIIWEDATPISLVQPNNTPGIDFQLDLAGSISGHVYQSSGSIPIASAWVAVFTPAFDYLVGWEYTSSDGSYKVDGITSGSYYVYVMADGFGGVFYIDGYDDPSATLINVTAPAETPGIDFHLSPEAKISGTVYQVDGVTPIQGARMRAWPYQGGIIRQAYTNASGEYTIGGLSTGSYAVMASATGFVASFYGNSSSWWTSTPVAVTQPATTSGINFALKTPIYTNVTSAGGKIVYTDPQGKSTTITIPAGAVGNPVDLVFTPYGIISPPSGFTLAGHSFGLDALQGSSVIPGFTFNQPVLVAIQYSDFEVAGMDELQLKLLYYDTTQYQWLDAAGTCTPASTYIREPAINRLSVAICHLSRFGLFAPAPYTIYLPKVTR